ncbi:MAG TPA: CdaR family protein [Bacteroidia bacterium]|jgi:YbbR domain-containing protein
MKSPFIKSLEPGAGKEKILLNKRVATFLCCVFISVLFWLLMTLSKDYTITIAYPVNYINSPKDKVIANNLPAEISMEIRSKGFFLLAYQFREPQTVYVDLNESHPMGPKNHHFLRTNLQLNKFTDQFSSRIKIQRIIPDTIFLNFNKKTIKRVPVKANVSLTMDSRYQQSDSILLDPAYVDISGAADIIDKIDHVETVPVSLENVDKKQTLMLTIKADSGKRGFEISSAKVKAVVNVIKFTEATIELPIEAENLPEGYTLKSFPDKVIVKYNVAFDNYEKITPQQFRAVIDYKKAEPGSNKLKISLDKFPADIRSVKLNPEKVEYILKK